MADTSVEGAIYGSLDAADALHGPYYINTNTGIIVFVDDGQDLSFAFTGNGGTTWTTVEIETGTVRQVACWFDRETPGDSGTLIHIVWLDTGHDDFHYITIDVSDNTVSTLRTLASGLVIATSNPADNKVGITKTVGGNLLAAYLTNSSTPSSAVYRSVDSGANWTSRTNIFESDTQEDWILFFPADTADNQDVAAIYWDISANEISIKMYDDSANTWTETIISGSMIEDPNHMNMDGSVRHSDSHVLFAAHSNDDDAGDDLMTWDLTVDSISTPTVTAKTNIFTNQGESAQVAVIVNQQNDDVYIGYLKGGTWLSTVDAVFHKSTDDMGTWEGESAYSEDAADDLRLVSGCRSIDDSGGRVQWGFFNSDLTEVFVNLTNDIEIAAVTPPGAIMNQLQGSNLGADLYGGSFQ